MKMAYLAAIAILIVVVVALASAFTLMPHLPASTPPIDIPYSYSFSVLNPQVTEITSYLYDNVSQGLPLQISLTFTSKTSQQLSIPIENVTLTPHNSTAYNENFSFQQKPFSYSLSINPLNLQPNSSNSTVIAVTTSDNIPLGYYTVGIDLGTVEEVYANRTAPIGPYGNIGFDIIVTPKTTPTSAATPMHISTPTPTPLPTALSSPAATPNATQNYGVEIYNFSSRGPQSISFGVSGYTFSLTAKNVGSAAIEKITFETNLTLSDGEKSDYYSPTSINALSVGGVAQVSGGVTVPNVFVNLYGLNQTWVLTLITPQGILIQQTFYA